MNRLHVWASQGLARTLYRLSVPVCARVHQGSMPIVVEILCSKCKCHLQRLTYGVEWAVCLFRHGSQMLRAGCFVFVDSSLLNLDDVLQCLGRAF